MELLGGGRGGAAACAAVVLLGLAGCGPSAEDSRAERDLENLSKATAYRLTAEQLAREFARGRARADTRYRGRYLEVEGLVDRVRRNSLGRYTLVLQGYAEPGPESPISMEIDCQLAAGQDERAAELSRGQRVRLRGKCEGASTDFFVDLADAELVEVGADPSLPVTAEQLTRDYAADRVRADEKYHGRPLLIEGTFLDWQVDVEESIIVLAGFDEQVVKPLRVNAADSVDPKAMLDRLKKGEKIIVKGECCGLKGGAVCVSSAVLVKKK